MKEIKKIIVDKSEVVSKAGNIRYTILGDVGAIFSVQVVDASSPSKFYNFLTSAFTATFTSENVLSNIEMNSSVYSGSIKIPAASSGNTYKIMVFADTFFNTKIADSASSDNYLLMQTIDQGSDVTVRFSTSTDQTAHTARLVGIGAFIGSTSGSSNAVSNVEVNFTETLNDTTTGAKGYKWTAPTSTNPSNILAENLQPKDSDFYVEIAT